MRGEHDAKRPGERPGDTKFVEDVLAQCMSRQPDTCVALDSLLTRTLLVLFVLALFVLIFAVRVLVSIFRLVDQDAVLLAKSYYLRCIKNPAKIIRGRNRGAVRVRKESWMEVLSDEPALRSIWRETLGNMQQVRTHLLEIPPSMAWGPFIGESRHWLWHARAGTMSEDEG